MSQPPLVDINVETTEITVVSGAEQPHIAQADITIISRTDGPVTVRVASVHVVGKGRSEPRPQFSLYDVTHEQAIDGTSVEVAASVELRLAVGFPAVTWWPARGESITVELDLHVEQRRTVSCPVSVIEEFPT